MNEEQGNTDGKEPMNLHVASRTHIGLRRQTNQDFLSVRGLAGNRSLLIVADGMGGHKGGERASQLAVETFIAVLEGAEDRAEEMLTDALSRANQAVVREAKSDADLEGMGTTFVAALLREGKGTIINLGDSRACLFRSGKLLRVTKDHSLVGEMVERGEITQAEAEVHPRKNVLTRAIGIADDFRPDQFQVELRTGDILLLCSDGLYGMVSDREIENILATEWSLEAQCDGLIDAALDGGGKDNVTVILARLGEEESGDSGTGRTVYSSGPATDPGDDGEDEMEWDERADSDDSDIDGEGEVEPRKKGEGDGWVYLLIAILVGLSIWGAIEFDLFSSGSKSTDGFDTLGIDTNGLILDSNTQLTPSDMVNDSIWGDSLSLPGENGSRPDTGNIERGFGR